jgi:hypothetical protein
MALTQSELDGLIEAELPTNGKNAITAVDLRNVLHPINSAVFQPFTNLNTWTAQQQFNSGALVPTRAPGDNSSNVASTAFVQAVAFGSGSGSYSVSTADTFALLQAMSIPSTVNLVSTGGYHAYGDGGGATYKRVTSPTYPSYAVQSADGAWWQYVPEPDGWNAKVAGIVADGTTPDSDNLQKALLPFQYPTTIQGGGNLTGRLFLPNGPMIMDKPVVIATGYASLELVGQQNSGSDGGGWSTSFVWNPTDPQLKLYPSAFMIHASNQMLVTGINVDTSGHQSTNSVKNAIHVNADNTYLDHLTASVTVGQNQVFTVGTTNQLSPNCSLGVGYAGGPGGASATFEVVFITAVTSTTTFVADCRFNHASGEQVGGGGPCNNITFRRCQASSTNLSPYSTGILVGNGITGTVQAAQVILDACYLVGGANLTPVTVSLGSPGVVNDPAHGLTLGRPVKLTDSSGQNCPAGTVGLYYSPIYYVIPIDNDNYHVTHAIDTLSYVQNTSSTIFTNVGGVLQVNWGSAHGFSAGMPVVVQTMGSVPSLSGVVGMYGGIAAGGGFCPGGKTYYIVNPTLAGGAAFNLAATPGGAAITYSGTAYGTSMVIVAGPSVVLVNTSGVTVSGVYRYLLSRNGFYVYGGGNVKNFFIFNSIFLGFEIGINGDPMSGSCEILYPTFGGNFVADIQANGASNIHVLSAETESSGQRFLMATGGEGAILATLEQNSYQCGAPFDLIVVKWPGNLTLINNDFFNEAQDCPAIKGMTPKIQVGDVLDTGDFATQYPLNGSISAGSNILTVNTVSGTPLGANQRLFGSYAASVETGQYIVNQISGTTGGTGTYTLSLKNTSAVTNAGLLAVNQYVNSGGIFATGNYYQWGGPLSPVFIDGSNNSYTSGDYQVGTKPKVFQFNDFGEFGKYHNSVGYVGSLNSSLGIDSQSSGLINVSQGVLTDGCYTVTVPYTAVWIGATSQILNLGDVPPKTKIVSIVADVTAGFVGAPITIQVGSSYGGNDLLTSFSAVTASFTGSISGTVLTASSVTGTILPGQLVLGSGTSQGTKIVSNGTGTGGAGTYNLNISNTISGPMTTEMIKGLLDADLGTSLQKSSALATDGFCPAWNGGSITATFTATSGSLSLLTAGSVTFYIATRGFR